MTHRKPHGFTLIELAVVLTIIGLLAAGLLVGKDVLRRAEIRAVMRDVEAYRNAVQQFQDKFDALPGDMYNATENWGTDDDCPAPSQTPKRTTCNGDGDGHIALRNEDSGATAGLPEMFLAWQHLANAGFIDGQYSGAAGPGAAWETLPRTNVPELAVSGVGLQLYYLQADTNTSALFFPAGYGHVLVVGRTESAASTELPFLTAVETQAIDTKTDDGLPDAGRVLALKSQVGTCVQDNNPSTPRYTYGANTATSETRTCSLVFITGL